MNTPTPRILRSILAVLLGIITTLALSFGMDEIFHLLHVYPAWGQPMYDTSLNLLSLFYRIVFVILGGYVTAKLAPHNRLQHAMIFGWIGFGFSVTGAVAAILVGGMGPTWHPVLLSLSMLPSAYAGGKLGQH